jgi:hypothetical protein
MKEKKTSKKSTCVVLIPSSDDFLNQWKLAIKPAIERAGLKPLRADETTTADDIVYNVTQSIFKARLVFADVSGSNANVTYELGLAQAIGKQTIIACQDIDNVPRDIQGHSLLVYDPNDIEAFREKLRAVIEEILAKNENLLKSHVFPDLKFLDQNTLKELEYLRKKAKKVKVVAYPPTSDLFFNGRLIGRSPQTIWVNPDYETGNTISASNILFFEEHRYIDKTEIQKGRANVFLEPMPPEKSKERYEAEYRHMPAYIRWRGKNPRNPAIMRAISHYLLFVKAYDEAYEEAVELVETAPNWHLSYNQVGHVKAKQKEASIGCNFFEIVRAKRPDDFIGYYNLACVQSILGNFSSCLSYLQQILETPKVLDSYCYLPYDPVEEDVDFNNIRKDPKHVKEFKLLTSKLLQKWKAFKARKRR